MGEFHRKGYSISRFEMRHDKILRCHNQVNKLFHSKTKIYIFDSHRSWTRYDKNSDTIFFDTHFFDILELVTILFISGKVELTRYIAYALISDYFICKDEIVLALHYAELFEKEKSRVYSILKDNKYVDKELLNRQLLFVLYHEQCHGMLAHQMHLNWFEPFRENFCNELDRENKISALINSLDLSPIESELSKIDKSFIEEPSDFSVGYTADVISYAYVFEKLIIESEKKIDIPESALISKKKLLLYACENYIKGTKTHLLRSEDYEDDVIADGFALNQLIQSHLGNENFYERMRDSILAYFAVLFTMNIISCVDSCILNYRMEGYKCEDKVWNRMRLERENLNQIIKQNAFRKPYGVMIASDIVSYANSLIDCFDAMYAMICELAYGVEHPSVQEPYYPFGSREYDECYMRIRELLQTDY